MSAFDKNSPEQKTNSTSSTKNEEQGGGTTTGNNSPTTVGPNFSDVSNVGSIAIETTDQGAVAAGLQTALAALDSNATNTSQAISAGTTAAQEAISSNENATQAALGEASSVAQGQQNTTIKYVVYLLGAVALFAAVAYAYKRKG